MSEQSIASQTALQANGDAAISGTVIAGGLTVPGLAVNPAGTVQVIGPRVAYDSGALVNGTFSQTAATDGTVVAVLGTVSGSLKLQFAGLLQASTASGDAITSTLVTAASTTPYTYSQGKKGAVTLQIPTFGNLSMPVRQGETWTLTLVSAPPIPGLVTPALHFYWVPLGSAASATDGGSSKPAEEVSAELTQGVRNLSANVASGTNMGATSPATMAEAQRIIDERVGDFTRILGNATGMSTAPEDRNAFMEKLQAIVCRASPAGTEGVPVEDASLDPLVDSFARVTGRIATAEQRALLKTGVRALVEINANQANRRNLDLIKGNIARFLDIVAQVLNADLGQDRRLLTRALVRLVGDGSHQPEDAMPHQAAA